MCSDKICGATSRRGRVDATERSQSKEEACCLVSELTYCLYRDPRVPQRNKLALAAAMALILNPVVDVPLRLPVFGEMDAVALTVLAVRLFVDKAPKDVVAEHQERIALGTSVFDQDLRRSREGLRGRMNALRGLALERVSRRGVL